jgi:formylglycine-generating enzyme required for sulfatase activity/serine/threonine protein kinase
MPVSIAQFLERLETSGILSTADLAAVRDSLGDQDSGGDAEPLAKRLHKEGRLTGYQVQALWKGKGQPLALGNYVIEDELGRGGMGVVLKARHKRMQRYVAIKVLPAAMVKDKAAIARFQREVVAAAKLTHSNIVGAFDADEINGQHILVMEFVDGRDLSSIVKKQGPLPVPQAIDCIMQAARGLEFAHKQGVIHRDIKPANLLLDAAGTVKILDMGLARFSGTADVATQAELTGTGTVMGTVDYMSPEQALSTKTADHRADIYSLGISLHYLLTGKPAYPGESLTARLMAHANAPIPSLAAERPDLSTGLQQVFVRMVAKKVDERYQSMSAVIADLEACQNGATGSSTFVQSKSQPAEESSGNLSAFLHQLGDSNAPGSAVTTVEAKSEQRTQTAAEQPTLIAQAEEQTERTLPPRTGVREPKSPRRGSRPPWTDWRVLSGVGVVAVLLLTTVIVLSRPGSQPPEPDPGPPLAASAVSTPAIAASPKLSPYEILTSPEYEWTPPENLGPGVNTSAVDRFPALSADGLRLVYLSFGRGNVSLCEATRLGVAEPFGPGVPLGPGFGDRLAESGATISGDGLLLLFGSKIPDGSGETGLYQSTRPALESPFGKPVCLGSMNSPEWVVCPSLSSDGLSIWFGFSRPGGSKTGQYWMSRRSSLAAEFSEPAPFELPLVPGATSHIYNDGIALSSDQRVLIFSPNYDKAVANDLYLSVRPTAQAPFGTPVNLGPAINSDPHDAQPTLSADGTTLIFSSTRRGGVGENGDSDLWMTRRVPKGKAVAPPAARSGGALSGPDLAALLNDPGFTWSEPENLGPGINGNAPQALAGISDDDLRLYTRTREGLVSVSERSSSQDQFPQGRPVLGLQAASNYACVSADGLCWVAIRQSASNPRQLWLSERAHRQAAFPEPRLAPPLVNSHDTNHPALSGDGLTLLVTSTRPGSSYADIWMFTRPARDQPFDTVEQLPEPVNTPGWDMPTFISNDRLLIISMSQNPTPQGNRRTVAYFTRASESEPFEPGRPLGIPLGSFEGVESNGAFRLSGDGGTLYFHSDVYAGITGRTTIWMSRRIPRSSPVPTDSGTQVSNGTAPPLAIAPFDAAQARAHQEVWAGHLGTTVETTNSVGQSMILIPPGEFLMGSSDEQVAALLQVADEFKLDEFASVHIPKSERPQHRVVITRPLRMSATEVTVGQFKQFSASGYRTEAERAPTTVPQSATYLQPGHAVSDDSPAGAMTWNDAVAYCEWLSGEEQTTYRLPTEAEWEYACRAGNESLFSFGDDYGELANHAWYQKNSGGTSHPVATSRPNAFGLYDMHANLWEWCGDYYSGTWYERSLVNDPVGPASGSNRVIRGGSWDSAAPLCRSAYRPSFVPSQRHQRYGFRIVQELSPRAESSTTVSTAELLNSDDYEWTEPENLGPGVNSQYWDEHPAGSDGLTLWYSGGGEILTATRPDLDSPFSNRQGAGSVINDGPSWDSAPELSFDGLQLVFQSGRGSPNGDGNLDLFLARRPTLEAPFGAPERLDASINSPQGEGGPYLSADGLTLVYPSGRQGGAGNLDLWQATRPSLDAEFGAPTNLGRLVNSPALEADPCLSADGTVLLFASTRESPNTNSDLWLCTRPDATSSFGPPVPLGPIINTGEIESGPDLSRDGQTLFFYSHRSGGHGQADLWSSRRVRKTTGDQP